MKKTKLLAILFVLVLVLALVSCGCIKYPVETNGPEVTQEPVVTEPPRPTYEMTPFSNWQDYTIVYKDDAAAVVSRAFDQFNLKLGEKYNFIPRAESDFMI